MLKWLGRIFALLLACSASALFAVATGATAFQSAIRSPDTLKEAFRNQDVYRQLLPITIPTILEASGIEVMGTVPINAIIEVVPPDAWQNIMRDLLPSRLLQAQVESGIDVLYQIWGGNNAVLDTSINLTEISQQLRAQSANAAQSILEYAPACTADQVQALQTIQAGQTATLPICAPTDAALYETSYTTIKNALEAVAEQFATSDIKWGDFFRLDLTSARVTELVFNIAGQLSLLLYLLPFALVCLVVFIIVRSLKGFGRWLGAIAFLSASLILALIFALQAVVISAFTESIIVANELERYIGQFFVGLMRSMFSEMSGTLLLFTGLFIIIGFALFFVAMVAPHPDALVARGSVLITADGQIISTASQRRTPHE